MTETQSSPAAGVTIDGGRFVRDGKPHQLISGALHYFRVPPALWADRLQRLVAMGCNTVETYVAWNFHQPWRDRAPSFDGDRDLGAFLDLAAAAGLDVLVRPGPYICAEWEFGGLPSWLLADPAVRRGLRTSEPGYQDQVDRWFDALVPVIAERQVSREGRVIGVQVENEYGSFGNDPVHLRHLRDRLIELGIDVWLFTSDGPGRLWLQGGMIDDTLATINFGSRQESASRRSPSCERDSRRCAWNSGTAGSITSAVIITPGPATTRRPSWPACSQPAVR
ncbi:beta-galactosidase [Microlunatus speluncae]|uniref:beta-galactosidase n=1 Tax=Microlunatus speluncae TaxID=2594267 RepID=UPI001C2D3D16|nr:beta-galactosidase [Microlunatus speluncae]